MDSNSPPIGRMVPDDRQLIQKAQRGDMSAFEQLVFRHDKQVLAVAARYVLSADDAKDIYQEVFLRVYRGLKGYRFRSEFSTWLYRITINVCLTHRSREKRTMHVPLHDSIEEEDGEPHHAQNIRESGDMPDQQAISADIALHVQQALELLSPTQRLVFTLRHYQGYRLREIASMMNCMEGTVKRYLFVATRRMRKHLKDIT